MTANPATRSTDKYASKPWYIAVLILAAFMILMATIMLTASDALLVAGFWVIVALVLSRWGVRSRTTV